MVLTLKLGASIPMNGFWLLSMQWDLGAANDAESRSGVWLILQCRSCAFGVELQKRE